MRVAATSLCTQAGMQHILMHPCLHAAALRYMIRRIPDGVQKLLSAGVNGVLWNSWTAQAFEVDLCFALDRWEEQGFQAVAEPCMRVQESTNVLQAHFGRYRDFGLYSTLR